MSTAIDAGHPLPDLDPTLTALERKGKEKFDDFCRRCHGGPAQVKNLENRVSPPFDGSTNPESLNVVVSNPPPSGFPSSVILVSTPLYLDRGIGPTVLHPEVGDIPLLRNAFVNSGVKHTFEELPGDHFTSLPQALANSLTFVLNNLGKQDGAVVYDSTLRRKHIACHQRFRN